MNDNITKPIRESYDRLAEEYARRISDELQHKPLDRALLDRFVKQTAGQGDVCDMGCGPGHVARYLRDAGASVFGLDLSPAMLVQARKLNPDILFHEGNMMKLDIPDENSRRDCRVLCHREYSQAVSAGDIPRDGTGSTRGRSSPARFSCR